MMIRLDLVCAFFRRRSRSFRSDAHGNVAVVFAFASTALLLASGAGIDLARAYFSRQKLSEVATLTCQYSMRPSVVNATGANSLYASSVNAFAINELTTQNWPASSLPTGGSNGSGSTYFTATGASASSNTQEPTGTAELWYNMPTTFMKIFAVNQITVHAVLSCQPPALPQASQSGPLTPPQTGMLLVSEGFETGKSGYYFTNPSGQVGTSNSPLNTFPVSAGYQGDGGNQFYIMGYCLEVDAAGVISASDPQGTHSAELDCDNGSSSAGNSSISTKVNLPTGYYELRYNYRSRVDYGNYDPAYICGSTASDLSWANDNGSGSYGQRTNQINVYFDQSVGGAAPPTHTTIDGTQQLAGSNLIDMCIYGPNWIERSVKIKITTAGYYWLSFAADGHNDSYGGQLDNIRLCVEQCSGSLQDNFPPSWLPQYGLNTVLFEDSFEAPKYTADPLANSPHAKGGNMGLSFGSTSSSSSSCYSPLGVYNTPPGWPCQGANGWSVAPFNEIVVFLQGAYQGSQYISLDGNNGFSTGPYSTNRLISRPFLLVPGFYQVSYNYISNVDFSSTVGIQGTYCSSAPISGNVFASFGLYTTVKSQNRYQNGVSTANTSTNLMGVFMSHGQLTSTPVVANAPWSTGANANTASPALGTSTNYTNPDGSISMTPTFPPDNVSWTNYNASAYNPVLDACLYVDSFRWTARNVAIEITKSAVYWLTFSSNGGSADGNGPAIDDVKLTALGSPYMSNPPTSPLVAIPTPAPASGSVYTGPSGSFTGFHIVADPFSPPAADQ